MAKTCKRRGCQTPLHFNNRVGYCADHRPQRVCRERGCDRVLCEPNQTGWCRTHRLKKKPYPRVVCHHPNCATVLHKTNTSGYCRAHVKHRLTACSGCGGPRGTGRRAMCQACFREWTHTYEKTPTGFLMRAYRNMTSRVRGVQKKSAHLYQGLPILPKEDFYAWARSDSEFWRLFRLWVAAQYERRLCPSVNRIDPSRGYTIDNIEWVTMGVNSSLAQGGHRADMRTVEKLYADIA